MKHSIILSLLGLTGLLLTPCSRAEAPVKKPKSVSFALYAPGQSTEHVQKLCKLLEGDGKVELVNGFEAALKTHSEVLMLLIDEGVEPFCFTRFSKPPQLEPAQRLALQKRKVVGIGYGAALILGAVGMEIDLSRGRQAGNEMEVRANSLCPQLQGRRFALSDPGTGPDQEAQDEQLMTRFAIQRPSPTSALEEIVRPLGQDSEEPEYVVSTVLRQGQHVLVTYGVSPGKWTPEFGEVFRSLAKGLAKMQSKSFSGEAKPLSESEPLEVMPPQEPVLGRLEVHNPWVGEVVKGPKGDWLKLAAVWPAQRELKAGENLSFNIQYSTASRNPVRIWATAGACNYAPSSPVQKPSGNVDRFVVSDTQAQIKAVEVEMVEILGEDKRNTLVRMRVPIPCQWSGTTPEAQARAERSPVLGRAMPNLKFTSIDNREIDLAQLKGKVVLIDFWATWCAPCKKEMPYLIETYAACKERGFEIVGINLDSQIEDVRKYCNDHEIGWPQYFDGKGWENAIAKQWAVQSIPACYLLDRNGTVRHIGPAGARLREMVEELCRQEPTSKASLE